MKTTFFIALTCILSICYGQRNPAYEPVRKDLMQWDSIRGGWIYEAVLSIQTKQPVPDRTFPEDLTPVELFSLAPERDRESLQYTLSGMNQSEAFTQLMSTLVNATYCSANQGRSYGDPHIVTYDNTSYSFQTVGEFILTKVGDYFEVQARQKPQRDDFSLNTAVAINLYGDRIAYYAEDVPDGSNSPLWLNGKPIRLEGRTYYLPCGGSIRLIGRNYIVSGPLGEKVIIDNRGSANRGFVNLTVNYPSCNIQQVSGLLGNANRNRQDEFQVNQINQTTNLTGFIGMNSPEFASLSQDVEQRYQNEIIKDFAEIHRVTQERSLFDYRPGLTTSFYTDRSFPRIIRTFNSIPNTNRDAARNRCQQMGVSEAEMNGCIFDAYYLDLNPNPIPTPPPATEGVVLNKLRHPMVNSNTIAPSKFPENEAQPLPTKPIDSTSKPSEYEPVTKPSTEPVKPAINFKVPEPKAPNVSKPISEPKPIKTPPASPAPKSPPASVPSKGKG
jgi:hypothetical protein